MDSKTLETERRGDVLIVRFARPEIRSPLSVSVVRQLTELMSDLSVDHTLRRLVFTGSDGSFASGADLREIAAVSAGEAREFAERGQTLMRSISELTCKTVAAVDGYCFGGALDLALACKYRIASPGARFAHPGAGLGIITGWGGTQRLPRLIGQARALEMFFTARPVPAEAAFRMGLIDLIDEDPLARAIAFVDFAPDV